MLVVNSQFRISLNALKNDIRDNEAFYMLIMGHFLIVIDSKVVRYKNCHLLYLLSVVSKIFYSLTATPGFLHFILLKLKRFHPIFYQ